MGGRQRVCLRQGTEEAEVPQAVRKPDSIRWKLQQEVSPLWEMPSAVGASKERMKVENLSYT